MQLLSLAMKANKDRGLPLPARFKGLENVGALFRRGQTSLICAAPGGGKSAIATETALFSSYKSEDPEVPPLFVPTMYFSADSDESTLGDRATAAIVGKDTQKVHQLLKDDDPETWQAQIEATGHIWMDFDSSPSMDHIYNEVEAYCYALGSFPELVVVDNIMNVRAAEGSGMGTENLYAVMEGCHHLARETGSHVMVLHHVTGEYTNGDIVIPRSGIMGKIDKVPRLILTLHRPSPDVMAISVVKNSNGPADPNGVEVQVLVPWMPATSYFGGTI